MGFFSATECRHCGSREHASADCPHDRGLLGLGAARECRHCGSKEHALRDCPHPRGFFGIGAATQCEHCHSREHAWRDCPHPRGFFGIGAATRCAYCDSKEHATDGCPHEHGVFGMGARTECRHCRSHNHATKDCPHQRRGARRGEGGRRPGTTPVFKHHATPLVAPPAGEAGGGAAVLVLMVLALPLLALAAWGIESKPAGIAVASRVSVPFETEPEPAFMPAPEPLFAPAFNIQPVSLLEPSRRVDLAHDEINQVYHAVMATLTPAQKKVLRRDERAWIKWRDAEAARMAHPLERQEALLLLIEQRTSYLREYRPGAFVAGPVRWH